MRLLYMYTPFLVLAATKIVVGNVLVKNHHLPRGAVHEITGVVVTRSDQAVFAEEIEFEVDPQFSPDGGHGHIVKLVGLPRDWVFDHLNSLDTRVIELAVFGSMTRDEILVSPNHLPQITNVEFELRRLRKRRPKKPPAKKPMAKKPTVSPAKRRPKKPAVTKPRAKRPAVTRPRPKKPGAKKQRARRPKPGPNKKAKKKAVQIEGVPRNSVPGAKIEGEDPGAAKAKRLKGSAGVLGTRNVLVIRVVANDSTTSVSGPDLRNAVFGVSGDKINLVERFQSCSFGKLLFEPFHGKSQKGANIDRGVTSVKINMNVKGMDNSLVRNAVTEQANRSHGDLAKQFDHVMLCLPPGTKGEWTAYGYANHWLTVYNDKFCVYPSAQVHEIGHNIHLSHAGSSDNPYGDKVGFMGFSYGQDEGPEMCFNAAKSWQLGWFRDRQVSIDPLIHLNTPWNGQLVGLVDYKDASEHQFVLIRLRSPEMSYYIGFNRKHGINEGTQMAMDKVTIQKQESTGSSTLVAALEAGQSHTISDFYGSGKTVVVKITAIQTTTKPWRAEVTISLQQSNLRTPPKTTATKEATGTKAGNNGDWSVFFGS